MKGLSFNLDQHILQFVPPIFSGAFDCLVRGFDVFDDLVFCHSVMVGIRRELQFRGG
jgi:hypothetical protein